jgi:hypothetical protein
MIKKISLLFFALLLSTVVVQAQAKKGAAKYNNSIIKLQHKVTPDIVKFFKAFEKGTAEDLKKQKAKLIPEFDAAIAKVSAMPDFEGDADLKNAALEWFKLYKSSFETEYEHIITLVTNRDRSKEDHEKLDKMTDDLVLREEAVDAQFEKAQVEFAKRHNLELIERPIK